MIKRNMVWSTAGLLVEIATGFLVLPFLITTLGGVMYGVWLVLGSLTVYLTMLELGVRGSIGRHLALYHARGDQKGVNQTFTVGISFLFFVGLSAFFVLILCEPLFFQFYTIPDGARDRVSLTFRLMAANIAIILVGTAFDAALWGYQRFDWLNAIDIPFLLARISLTFALVRSSEDLVVLGYISLTLWAGSAVCKGILTFRADPKLRFGLRYLNRSSFRELLGYGSWNIVSTIARMSRTQLGPVLLGAFLGLVIVPIYAIAARLLAALVGAMSTVTGVLTPHATALYATDQVGRQRHLFLTGGRYATTLGTFLIAYLLVLGAPLIELWVGPAFSTAATLLVVLVLGESLPCTQYVTNGIILASARHRVLALFALLETGIACALMITLLPILGLVGAGLALAIPAFLTRGVAPLVHGCRILGVSVTHYLVRAIAPPILCAVLPVVVVRFISAIHPITSWSTFVAYSAIYVTLFGTCYGCGIGRGQVRYFFRNIRSRRAPPRTVGEPTQIGTVAARPVFDRPLSETRD